MPKSEIRDYFMTLRLPEQAPMSTMSKTFDETYMQNLIQLSSSAWKDVMDADAWVHQLRGE